MQEDISNQNGILGLQWDKFDDKFFFDISKICEKNTKSFDKKKFNTIHTKYIQSIRYIHPVTVKLKILFQDVCCEKFAWDINLPQSYLLVFYDIGNGLREVQKVLFERLYFI